MSQLRDILCRVWAEACRDEPNSNCRIEDGEFVFTLRGKRESWAMKIDAAGVPEAADQVMGSEAYVARWKSHADAIFGPDGMIAQKLPNYEMRDGQLHMARIVQRAVEMDVSAAIEASTGVGKSFAYAAPCLALDKKVIISTSNKALQNQLVTKDIPFLLELFPGKTLALAVGKENYACRAKVEDVSAGAYTLTGDLLEWYLATDTGNIEEIPYVLDAETLARTRLDDDCAGKYCPRYGDCFYYVAKKQREEADVDRKSVV